MDKKKRKSISTQSLELAEVVPQIMLSRFAQMASAGPQPSMEDVVEFNRMWSEKTLVAMASWSEINKETLRYQQKVMDVTNGFWSAPWMMPQAFLAASMMFGPNAAKRLLGKGLAPVHKVALANAERLIGEAKS